MKAISSPAVNLSWLGLIYEDIRCLAAGLRIFTIRSVRRSANYVAHSLARYACNIDTDFG